MGCRHGPQRLLQGPTATGQSSPPQAAAVPAAGMCPSTVDGQHSAAVPGAAMWSSCRECSLAQTALALEQRTDALVSPPYHD